MFKWFFCNKKTFKKSESAVLKLNDLFTKKKQLKTALFVRTSPKKTSSFLLIFVPK